MRSFLLVFLLFQNSVLDVNFFELLSIESVFKSFGKVVLVGFEGVQIPSLSNLELCHSFILLDQNSCINNSNTFLCCGCFGVFGILGNFVTFSDLEELLEISDFFRLS